MACLVSSATQRIEQRFSRRICRTRTAPIARRRLRLEPLEARQLLAADPIITEWMANNEDTLLDGDGNASDWIEIYNAGDAAADLSGYFLTDDAADPDKWPFPAVTLPRGKQLVVFASGQAVDDYVDPSGNLHTNFRLAAGGDFLALVRPDLTVASQFGSFNADYPAQYEDISFGLPQTRTATTLFAVGDGLRYSVPAGPELPPDWAVVGFDDTSWNEGANGIGFDVPLPNIAPAGTATQSSTGAGAPANRAIDGDFGNYTHTTGGDDAATWTLELGQDNDLYEIVIYNRTNCCGSRLRDVTVTITDAADAVVYESDLLNPENELGRALQAGWDAGPAQLTLDLVGLTGASIAGSTITIARTSDPDLSGTDGQGNADEANVLSLGEVEVFATVPPEPDEGGIPAPVNVAAGKSATQSTDYSASYLAPNAIDGNPSTFTHTVATDANASWTVDLGADFEIDNIVLHNRQNAAPSRLRDVTVTILDATGRDEVYVSALLNPENVLGNGTVNAGPNQLSLDLVALTGSTVLGGIVTISRAPDPDLSGSGGEGNASEANVLSLSEVEVNAIPTYNAAVGRTATQSTTSGSLPAGNAVDGNLSNFSHTASGDATPWWQVELGEDRPIYSIALYNRTGYLSQLRDVTVTVRDAADTADLFVSELLNPENILRDPAAPWSEGPARLDVNLLELTGAPVTGGIVRVTRTADPDLSGSDGQGNADEGFALALNEVVVNTITTVSRENLAAGKPATQSTQNGGFAAGLATDGNYSNFTHTYGSDAAPAWQVDLGAFYRLDEVVLYNRADCCQTRLRDVTVEALADDGETVLWTSPLLNVENELGGPATIRLDLAELAAVPVFGQFVRVRRAPDPDLSGTGGAGNADEANVLSLAEVEVFGELAMPFEPYFQTDVTEAMFGRNASLLARLPFTVADPMAFDRLTLQLRYADGFIASLNGTEVLRRAAPDPAEFDAAANGERSDAEAIAWQELDLTEFIGLLAAGDNVLAFQAMSGNAFDTDFLLVAELFGEDVTTSIGDGRFMDTPTPNNVNGGGTLGFVADTQFNVDRGFFDATDLAAGGILENGVTITSATPGASVIFTIDGSVPSPENGTVVPPDDANTPPTAVIPITQTTTLRASAFKDEYRPTNVDTQTYIFVDDVIEQSDTATPAGWPAAPVNNQRFNYGMDPEIAALETPETVKEALTSIPTLSIVTDLDNLVDSSIGIYVNAQNRGKDWERPVSVEILYPDGIVGDNFQIDAGLRIRGGASRGSSYVKHSFRLFFREDYGEAKLRYPMFGDEGAGEFDNLDLRTSQNYSWPRYSDYGMGSQNTLVREVWTRDTQGATGQPYAKTRYYHLYLDGQYWGIYQTQERAEASFGATYFGGDKDNFDTIKSSNHVGGFTAEATDGNLDAWRDFWEQARYIGTTGPSLENYMKIQGLNLDGTRNPDYPVHLDADNLIDYMLGIFHSGDGDAPLSNFLGSNRANNWFTVRDRTGDLGWQFFRQDGEHTLGTSSSQVDRTGPFTGSNQNNFTYSNPQWIHQDLMAIEEYRLRFADRVYKHFFNDGAMTEQNNIERFLARASQIETAIIAQSARWGDAARATPYNKADWEAEINDVVANFFPGRNEIVLAQLRADGLYPNVEAPVFGQHGGQATLGFPLEITQPAGATGTIYYTADGSDPRELGGAVAGSAVPYVAGTPIALLESQTVSARVLDGTEWSPLNSAAFYVNEPAAIDNLAITEIQYNPTDDADVAEFIEIRNIGAMEVDLGGVQFVDGVTFDFSNAEITTVAPGEYVVVVKDRAAFEARYGTEVPVAGEFDGGLKNSGERVSLVGRFGGSIEDFTYDDSGAWPGRADGNGSSLELADLAALPNTQAQRTLYRNDGDHWRPSIRFAGTPGADGMEPVNGVIVNEVLAHTDDPGQRDAIELYNTADDAVDVGGWYLSDSNANYMKFQIPAGTEIPAGGYWVFDETDFNPNGPWNPEPEVPGPGEFALSGTTGDDVWLTAGAVGGVEPLWFADRVEFGATENGVSLGRVPDGDPDMPLFPNVSITLEQPNSGPRFGPVVISELMYQHPSADDNLEFIELHNSSAEPVGLADWQIAGGVGFSFEPGTVLPGRGTMAVLPFDPAEPLNAALVTNFEAAYGVTVDGRFVGGYLGRLSDSGESVRILRPDEPVVDGFGNVFIPGTLEDEIQYEPAGLWPGDAAGLGDSLSRTALDAYGNDPAGWTAETPTPGNTDLLAGVVGRHVFYNGSVFDGNDTAAGADDDAAIAADKRALLPGQSATFANYTSYAAGINGLMVDVAQPAGTMTAADFEFRMGNDDTPADWLAAPAPIDVSIRPGAGLGGSDRVTIVFDGEAVSDTWLQVTVKGGAGFENTTNLPADDVFYFGNAVGETGNSRADSLVNAADVVGIRDHARGPSNPTGTADPRDFNRDSFVDALDAIMARNAATSPLNALRRLEL